jgi:hypothetical protein
MVEPDIVAYLAAAGLGLTAGVNLFEGEMLEAPDNVVAVAHYAGEDSDDYAMGPSLSEPGSEIEVVQVMTRSTSRDTARSTAAAIHNKLENLGKTLNFGGSGRTYFRIEGMGGPPVSIGQDANLRWRRVASYRVRKVRG